MTSPHSNAAAPARVLFRSPFVPAEWIQAHGLAAVRFLPDGDPPGDGPFGDAEGLCPFLRMFLNEAARAPDVAAVVFDTACDQERRAAEWFHGHTGIPTFLFNLPATWQTPAAHRIYRDEVARLGRFLESRGGRPPAPGGLAAAMEAREAAWRELDGLRARLEPQAAAAALFAFHRTGRAHDAAAVAPLSGGRSSPSQAPLGEGSCSLPPKTGRGVPLALVGGPLCRKDLALFEVAAAAGGRIVIDGSENGDRTRPARFDRRRLRDDALGALCDATFGAIPDAFRRPNAALFQWLRAAMVAAPVRGIVVTRYVWCDVWHAEVTRIREWAGVPVVDLDLSEDPLPARARTRLQAFVESLR